MSTDDISDPSSAPDEDIDWAEMKRMEDALIRMPRRLRRVFLSRRVGGRSHADIADKLGVTVADVERLMGKAVLSFSRNLDDPRRHWWRRWLR